MTTNGHADRWIFRSLDLSLCLFPNIFQVWDFSQDKEWIFDGNILLHTSMCFFTGHTIMCQGATSLIKLRSHTKTLTICVNINCASNLRVGYRNPVIVEALEGPTLWKYIRSIGYRSRDYSLYFSCLQYRTEPHRSLWAVRDSVQIWLKQLLTKSCEIKLIFIVFLTSSVCPY